MLDLEPGLPVLYISGYAMDVIKSRYDLVGDRTLLIKPIPALELLQRIREALDR
jgi:hypothetical protein